MPPDPPHARARRAGLLVAALVVALLAGACGSSVKPEADKPPGAPIKAPDDVKALEQLGPAEGRLRLVTRPGGVQAAGVRSFQARSGCQVSVTTAPTSREVAAQLRTGRYDGAALTGDVTVPLVTGGYIAPINPSLLRDWDGVFADLRQEAADVSGGRVFAVPVDRAINEVVWRRDRIPGTIRSSGALFDPAQAASYGDRLMLPDDPMTIADAAIWAVAQRPELKIVNPFELDPKQFSAALSVLRRQHQYVGAYWTQPAELEDALRSGEATLGYGPAGIAARLRAEQPPVPVDAAAPREGATGFVDTWAVAARARHPSCMYRWMGHLLTPAVNAKVAEQAGAAPANRRACTLTEATQQRCDALHADDEGHWRDVALWRTPTTPCGDGRGRVCKPYAGWAAAWERLTR